MRWSFSHPAVDSLVGFASRALSESDQRRIARHLESCSRCRESVAALRAVQGMARDVEPGDPLLRRILASRSAHVRTVLPTEDLVETAPHRRAAILAAAAAVGPLVALFLAPGSQTVPAGERTGF